MAERRRFYAYCENTHDDDDCVNDSDDRCEDHRHRDGNNRTDHTHVCTMIRIVIVMSLR